MKVFLAINTKTWGGGEKWHFETACALKNKGHHITLLAYAGKDLFRKSQAAGINTIPVSVSNLSFLNPFCLLRLFFLFRREKPDIVLLNSSSDIKTSGVAARWAGIRHIVFRRGSAIPVRNTLFNRLLYRHVITHIIANSEETKRTILQHNNLLFPADKITVIYNGINLSQLDALPADKLYQKSTEELVIGNMGRMVSQKGQQYLVEIARIFSKKGIRFRILIAGTGQLENSLKQMAIESGVEDKIVFLGFVDNTKAFMESIDIFALPSVWEGFGYVLVEAMACRKPVVAFQVSSNPEIIADSATGFLAAPMNVHEFSNKLEELGRNPELRKQFGTAGRKRAEALFDHEKSQQLVESLLMSL
ncbi:MAG: glycosyltransferase, partial [Bacteroidales bacterium]|nr:glycosyltransferase [Bacteroidales bacterium]